MQSVKKDDVTNFREVLLSFFHDFRHVQSQLDNDDKIATIKVWLGDGYYRRSADQEKWKEQVLEYLKSQPVQDNTQQVKDALIEHVQNFSNLV